MERETSFLDRKSIEVYPVPSNAEVLLMHREINADLIITYLDMPDMSGEALYAAILNDDSCPNVAIIMVCPNKERCDVHAGHGCDEVFITPPISAEVLLEKVYDMLKIPSRAEFRVPVSVKIMAKGPGMKPFLGFSENISISGMLLGSDRKLEIGDKIVCSFILAGNEHMKAEAQVVRYEQKPREGAPNRYGLKFTGPILGHVEDIERFIKEMTEEE